MIKIQTFYPASHGWLFKPVSETQGSKTWQNWVEISSRSEVLYSLCIVCGMGWGALSLLSFETEDWFKEQQLQDGRQADLMREVMIDALFYNDRDSFQTKMVFLKKNQKWRV